MNDEVLWEMPNEQPLEIEFVPVSADHTSISGAIKDVKMRVHL